MQDYDYFNWKTANQVLRYLNSTKNLGVCYRPIIEGNPVIGYQDADFGGDRIERKSTSGYVFMLSGSTVSWRSKK